VLAIRSIVPCLNREANGAKLDPASYTQCYISRLGGRKHTRSFVAPSRCKKQVETRSKRAAQLGTWHPIPVHQRNHSRPLRPRLPTSSCVSINYTTQVVGRLIAIMLIPKSDRKQIHEVRRNSNSQHPKTDSAIRN
jgi:hypothetical protein